MLTARGRGSQREVHQVPQPEHNDQARAFAPLMSVLGDWASAEDVAQLGRDLETARDIQERLLPRGLPNLAGVEIGVALAASKVIGGDFYDFVPMPGGVGIVVGDVSGKGIPAALLMVMTRTLFRAAAREEDVTSPTFTLLHAYGESHPVFHGDLYRIETFHDFETLGMEDLFAKPSIVILEWSERFPLPPPWPEIRVRLEHLGGDTRRITVL